MLRKVKFYGELADFIGHKELEAVINSTADAVSFLIHNFPKLEEHMANRSVSYTHLTLPTTPYV